MSLAYVEITGQFAAGDGSPATGTATFTPSQSVYYEAQPLVSAATPVQAEIVGGQLESLSGGALQLLATDNDGLSYEGLTGFFTWTVQVTLNGVTQDPWSFFLPSSPASRDLFSLASTPAPGAIVSSVFGRVGNVVAEDGDYTVGQVTGAAPLASPALTGTPTAPTAAADTDSTQVATTAYADRSAGNALSAAEEYAAGLQPTSEDPLPSTAGGTGLSESTAAALLAALLAAGGGTMGGELAPKVVTLTDAATIEVDASAANDQRVTLGGNRTMGVPSNPADGQVLACWIAQPSSGGPYTVTWAGGTGGYSFGSGSAPTLSTAASNVDFLAFRYNASLRAWCYQGTAPGFAAL